MSEPAPDRQYILIGPLRIWASLMLLAGLSALYAYLPGLPLKPIAALLIVMVQAVLVVGLFMQLPRANALVRVTALVSVVWLSFLFLMSFADILTR
jgi:cytochrome c oxidase subunit IV